VNGNTERVRMQSAQGPSAWKEEFGGIQLERVRSYLE
jgi:hypothetical protein